jgi:hypothetical protein
MWNQVSGTLSNSMAQAMGRFASLLPGILAFLVAVVLFSLIGWLLAWVVRRILIALHFDDRLGRGTEAVTEWSPRQTPAGLLGLRRHRHRCRRGCLRRFVTLEDRGRAARVFAPADWRGSHPAGGQYRGPLSVARRADWRGEHEPAVRAAAQPGDKVAGAGADRRNGAGPLGDRPADRRPSLRHPLWRHRVLAGALGRTWIA